LIEKPNITASELWADSILTTLNFKQLVGQTLMIPAWSRSITADPIVLSAIEKQEVGGIIFFQGSPLSQAYLQNYYQQSPNYCLPDYLECDCLQTFRQSGSGSNSAH
jgi:hypothetical protein